MRRSCFFALLWVAALFLVGCWQSTSEPVFRDHDGNAVQFSKYHNKNWVILSYWASWCPSCKAAIPSLNALAHEYRDQVIILGVNVFETASLDIKEQVRRFGMHYPSLLTDPGEYLKLEPIRAIPALVLIDPKGHVRQIGYGAKYIELFKKLIQSQRVVS